MKTLIYDLNKFNTEKFLTTYEKDLKNIFFSLEDENFIDLIDYFSVDNFTLSDKPNSNDIIKILSSKKLGLFLMLGAVADENVNYFRFLDGVQYRIAEGEVYEHSAERFHNFKTSEKILNCGDIDFSVETALGLTVFIKDNNIHILLGEIAEDSSTIEQVDDCGDFEKIIISYLDKFLI